LDLPKPQMDSTAWVAQPPCGSGLAVLDEAAMSFAGAERTGLNFVAIGPTLNQGGSGVRASKINDHHPDGAARRAGFGCDGGACAARPFRDVSSQMAAVLWQAREHDGPHAAGRRVATLTSAGQ
jgi:hypothetical protein